MKFTIPSLIVPLILCGLGSAVAQRPAAQPYAFFKDYIHLTDEEIREIQQGTPVTVRIPG